VPGQHVDRPALASDHEGHLRGALPTERNQDLDQPLHHCGVRGVQQPIQFLAVPTNANVQFRAEPDHNSLHRANRRPDEQASLHPRHGRLRYAAAHSEVGLPPAQPVS